MMGAAIEGELEAALENFGIAATSLVLVSPLRERKGERYSYRVETTDGRTIKLRVLESADRASFLLEARARIESAFAPALARCGRVLLEEWILGRSLSPLDEEVRAEEAGALLGRLHAVPLRDDGAAVCSTRAWIAKAGSDIELLASAGRIGRREARSLQSEIARRAPDSSTKVLIHKDFCAANMVIDADGLLRVIDNEQLVVEPAGLDLGRTFDRWPMSTGTWERFLAGYRSSAPAPVRALAFWQIVALLLGARIRFQRDPDRLPATLERLRALLLDLSRRSSSEE